MPVINKKSIDLRVYHELLIASYRLGEEGLPEAVVSVLIQLDRLFDKMSKYDKQTIYDRYSRYFLEEKDLRNAGIK